jgi:hypothetical protein
MELNTAEKFLLVVHHPIKSRFLLHESARKTSLVGALLMDLTRWKKVALEEGRLICTAEGSTLPEAHRLMLESITGFKKSRKIKSWLYKLSRKGGAFQKSVLHDLEKKGLLKVEYKKFLFIPYTRSRLTSVTEREQIIMALREIIFQDMVPDPVNSGVLGLMAACQQHKILARNREEAKAAKKRIREIMESETLTLQVDRVIKETQAAVMSAIIASTVAVQAGGR